MKKFFETILEIIIGIVLIILGFKFLCFIFGALGFVLWIVLAITVNKFIWKKWFW